MKRIAAYLASAALGAGLAGSAPAWAHMRGSVDMSGMGGDHRSVAKNQMAGREHRWNEGWQWRHRRSGRWSSGLAWRGYSYNPGNYAYNSGYPYNYAYGYGYPSNAYNYGYPYNNAYGYGYPSSYAYGYGYPYANSYGYSYEFDNPFALVTAPIDLLAAPVTTLTRPVAAAAAAPFEVATSATAPLLTGRSVATGQMGNLCSTPVKTCELYHASFIGNGCSCKVTGGRSRGTVSP
ncbi:MAG: hypothetical protein ACREDT_02285 [Methylocella sp.]